jgi:K+-transporting ATPase ATPase C chain
MMKELRPAFILVLLMTLLTGLIYPLSITGITQLIFPKRADGSLIEKDGRVIGSALIGQRFTRPDYFHPRPSAAGEGYEAHTSGGSNLSPSNRLLVEAVIERTNLLRAEIGERRIPISAVTASGSGLDPHISPQTAFAQASRIARARNMPEGDVWQLIRTHIEGRTFTILGEPRVNVLLLNLALDAQPRETSPPSPPPLPQ